MSMSIEIASLASMTLFFLWAWLPASLAKRKTYGRSYLLSNRGQKDLTPLPDWAQRSERAYENMKNYFPAFVVAILVLSYFGKSDNLIQLAAVVYVLSRILHFVFYTLGIVAGRATAWLLGILANTYLLIRIF